jgi:hypothetical protein
VRTCSTDSVAIVGEKSVRMQWRRVRGVSRGFARRPAQPALAGSQPVYHTQCSAVSEESEHCMQVGVCAACEPWLRTVQRAPRAVGDQTAQPGSHAICTLDAMKPGVERGKGSPTRMA